MVYFGPKSEVKVIEFQEVTDTSVTEAFWKWSAEADAEYGHWLLEGTNLSFVDEINRQIDRMVGDMIVSAALDDTIDCIGKFLEELKEIDTGYFYAPYIPLAKPVEPLVEERTIVPAKPVDFITLSTLCPEMEEDEGTAEIKFTISFNEKPIDGKQMLVDAFLKKQ